MRKSSVLCLFLLLGLSVNSFAKLKPELPSELTRTTVAAPAASGSLTLNKETYPVGLKLNMPEALAAPQADPARMMLILQFALSFPTGNFGDAYNTGVGGNLTFAYSLNPNVILTGSIGYIHWGGDNNLGGLDDFEGNGDFSMSSVPVLVGARYMFPTSSAFAPYVLGEIGLHFMSSSAEYSYLGYSYDASASSTEFALGLGGGFMYPVSASLTLDVNGRYWIISDAGNFTFMAGIGYALGAM
jgi:opacity protein-like surface antigen